MLGNKVVERKAMQLYRSSHLSEFRVVYLWRTRQINDARDQDILATNLAGTKTWHNQIWALRVPNNITVIRLLNSIKVY